MDLLFQAFPFKYRHVHLCFLLEFVFGQGALSGLTHFPIIYLMLHIAHGPVLIMAFGSVCKPL